VSQISLENRLNPGGEGASANGECWVWSFLKACLAPLVGYDEARAIVQDVQYRGVCSPPPPSNHHPTRRRRH
jgi:hypothetical protein